MDNKKEVFEWLEIATQIENENNLYLR